MKTCTCELLISLIFPKQINSCQEWITYFPIKSSLLEQFRFNWDFKTRWNSKLQLLFLGKSSNLLPTGISDLAKYNFLDICISSSPPPSPTHTHEVNRKHQVVGQLVYLCQKCSWSKLLPHFNRWNWYTCSFAPDVCFYMA